MCIRDSPGTEAANTLTETAERTWRIAESAHRSDVYKRQELGKQLKKIGMLVVQDAVWNRVTINRCLLYTSRCV